MLGQEGFVDIQVLHRQGMSRIHAGFYLYDPIIPTMLSSTIRNTELFLVQIGIRFNM